MLLLSHCIIVPGGFLYCFTLPLCHSATLPVCALVSMVKDCVYLAPDVKNVEMHLWFSS
jgi:hypothetical protein